MKKLISLLLVLGLCLSLCACAEEEVPVTEEQIEEAVEAVEEVLPDFEALAAEAKELYYNGDFAEVFAQLEALRDSGIDYVDELIALCRYHGYGTDIDTDAAVEMLRSAAEEGSAAAKLIVARATNSGDGAVQDPVLAEELFADFLKAVDTAAETLPGFVYTAAADCYARGIGVEADLVKAMEAAANAMSSDMLSVFDKVELAELLTSDMLKQNYPTQAEKLYKEALDGLKTLAKEDNVKAVKLLGDYYMNALGGLEQDYEEAMKYFMLAADEDYAPAQAQIALMYQDGLGVEVSYEQAMEWNNRAAMQGNAQAQSQIGYMYHMGLGVTQNLDEAGRWYSRAADQGDLWAAAKLAETEITNPQAVFEFHA